MACSSMAWDGYCHAPNAGHLTDCSRARNEAMSCLLLSSQASFGASVRWQRSLQGRQATSKQAARMAGFIPRKSKALTLHKFLIMQPSSKCSWTAPHYLTFGYLGWSAAVRASFRAEPFLDFYYTQCSTNTSSYSFKAIIHVLKRKPYISLSQLRKEQLPCIIVSWDLYFQWRSSARLHNGHIPVLSSEPRKPCQQAASAPSIHTQPRTAAGRGQMEAELTFKSGPQTPILSP